MDLFSGNTDVCIKEISKMLRRLKLNYKLNDLKSAECHKDSPYKNISKKIFCFSTEPSSWALENV